MTTSTGLHVGTRVRSLVDDGMFVRVGSEGVVWQQFGPLIEWDNNTRSSVSPDEVEVIP